jgi:hypothetical protein
MAAARRGSVILVLMGAQFGVEKFSGEIDRRIVNGFAVALTFFSHRQPPPPFT